VNDRDSKEPLMSVNVIIYNSKSEQVSGAATDAEGRYELKNIKKGSYTLRFSYSGYETDSVVIKESDFNSSLTYDMELKAGVELGNIEITAQVKRYEMDADKMVMNVDEGVAATASSAFDLLKKVPGVYIDNDEKLTLNGQGGVLFQFDGRDMKLPWEAIKAYLKGMSPTQIDKFEVINNPSAKYEAEGTAGIINIRMIKNLNYGFNGSVNAMTAYSTDWLYHGGVNLNYVDKKWTLTFGYNGARWAQESAMANNMKMWGFGDTLQYDMPESPMVFKMNNHNFNFGADYQMNDNNAFGINISYGLNKFTNNQDSSSLLISTYPYAVIDSMQYSKATSENSGNNLLFGAHYVHKFDSLTKVSFDGDFTMNNSNADNNSITAFYLRTDSLKSNSSFGNAATNNYHSTSLKADFERTLFGNILLEAGLKDRYTKVDNDFDANIGANGSVVSDPNRTNHFIYKENVAAGYLSATKKWETTSLRIGLRGEYTSTDAWQEISDTTNTNNYFNLFPNLNFNYQINAANRFSATYSYRITRPDYNSLNPFLSKTSDFSYSAGNPLLNPQYTHKVDLNYSWNYILFFNATYGYTKDDIMELPFLAGDPPVVTQQPQNIASSHNFNVSLSGFIPFGKYVNMMLWASENYWNSKSDMTYANLEQERWGFMGWGALNFMLPKDFKFTVSGFYMSGGVQGIYRYEDYFNFGCSIGKSFLQKRLELSIGVDDLFASDGMRVSYATDNNSVNAYFKSNQRRIGFTIRYNFGKMYDGNKLKKIEKDDMDDRSSGSKQQGGGGGLPIGQ
jgi:hypothetical protein